MDWIRFYGDSIYQTDGRAAVEHENLNIASVGTKSSISDGTQAFLLITDSMGDELEFRVFGGEDSDNFFSLYPTNDGGYILGGYTRSFGTPGKWDHYLVKTDSLGNQQWDRAIGSERDDCPAQVIQTADSNYIFCGCWNQYDQGLDPYNKLYMAKLDPDGEVVWQKEYLEDAHRFASLRKVAELTDGGFVAAGLREGPYDGLLLRTDAEGNELWLRSIQHPSIELNGTGFQFAYDIIPDGEGGFVGTGWMYSPPGDSIPGQDLWVFRTDSMGCLVPGCHLVDHVEVHEEEVLVSMFPNPVQDLLSVHVKTGPMPRGAQLQVYDMQGREQYTTALSPGATTYIVPMGHLPAGMYVLRCITGGEVVWSGKVLKE